MLSLIVPHCVTSLADARTVYALLIFFSADRDTCTLKDAIYRQKALDLSYTLMPLASAESVDDRSDESVTVTITQTFAAITTFMDLLVTCARANSMRKI